MTIQLTMAIPLIMNTNLLNIEIRITIRNNRNI